MPPDTDRVLGFHRLTWLALAVQGGLALVSVAWAIWFGLETHEWFPLDAWSGNRALTTFAATLAAVTPPVAAFLWMRSAQAESVVRFRHEVRRRLIPLFAETRFVDWFVISLTAGLTEEIAFRGALLDTFYVALPRPWNAVAAVVVPSLIFGALHALNRIYFVTTAAAGVYFSLIVLWAGDLWAASLAHFLYDLIVFAAEGPSARREFASTTDASDSGADETEAAATVPRRTETAVASHEKELP